MKELNPPARGVLEQAQALQERIARLQDEVARQTVEATAGGGMVTAVVSGKLELVALRIDPEVLKSPDVELLQDLIVAAVNQGIRKAQELMAAEVRKITGGLNIPGLRL